MKFFLYFSAFLALSMSLFSQNEKVLESQISKVIVYQQGALVTRNAKCTLPKGKTTLVFKGITSKLDPNYLQVKPSDADVVISSVSTSTNYLNKTHVSKQIEELNFSQKMFLDSLRILKDKKSVFDNEQEMILANKTIGGNSGLNVSELQNAATFYRTRLMDIENNLYQIDLKAFKLKERLVEISKEILELNQKQEMPTSEIRIVVNTSKTETTDIDLDYFISDATWTPFYDIRIKDVDNPLDLVYKAKVNQNTGEDWNEINLTLSTGNPSISNQIPKLENYVLTFNNYYEDVPIMEPKGSTNRHSCEGTVLEEGSKEPIPGCNVLIKGTSQGVVTDINGKFKLDDLAPNTVLVFSFIGYESKELYAASVLENVFLKPNLNRLDEVVVMGYGTGVGEESSKDNNYRPKAVMKKEIIPMAIQKQQTSTDFKIDIPYTIPSDKKDYEVSMVQYELPALYAYQTIPKLTSDAFLMVKLTDWVKYNLMNGQANIFFKGIYQGQSYLDLKSFEDTLTMSVGRDKDIIISRDIQKDFTTNSFVSSSRKVQKGWNISIKNNKDKDIDLTVEDQYPVSSTDDIKIEILDVSGGQIDKDSGKVKWKLKLSPGEKKVLYLKYSVKYPKDKKLIIE